MEINTYTDMTFFLINYGNNSRTFNNCTLIIIIKIVMKVMNYEKWFIIFPTYV